MSRLMPRTSGVFGISLLALAAPSLAVDDHLQLCEAVVTPTASEFLEIVNPTGAAVALDNYYLSDDEDYSLLAGASGAGPAPSIGSSDFIVQFPVGASIPAGGTMVVAFDGAGFVAAFGSAADFEIHGTDPGTLDMIPTNVGSTAGLTNTGENAVLFFWDGTSDLVADVDMVNIGTPSSTNDIGDKTGVSVDGPDADTTASMYLADLFTMPQQSGDPVGGTSAKRVVLETGSEIAGGGNGITGDDETTEQITTTWDSTFTAPDPGLCSTGSPPDPELVINEIDYDQDGTDNGEFIELKNVGVVSASLAGFDIVLVSGGGATVYDTITLPSVTLAVGDYFVICGAAANVANCDFDVSPDSNLIQNGSPDAVALLLGSSIVDVVSYEGDVPGFTEGTGVGFLDNNTDPDMSISRCDDGVDTDVNSDDFDFVAISPGAPNDCAVPAVPELVINEIIQNPAAVSDTNGEWLELFNPTVDAIDINGFTIADNDFDSHVINNGGPLLIAAGSYLVLGRDDTFAANGGVVVDYQYSGFFLSNGGDEVLLLDASLNEVDRVEYDNGATFPDPTGASMALASPASDNNDGINWCTSRTPFGDGDLGTPGAANDCPTPVINEIIQNPSAVSDSNGEWFEVFNPSGRPINLNGFAIKDDGSNSHVIDNGGPLLVPAGGYLVLGRNANSGTNGGVGVDYQYSGFFLGNGADEVVLVDSLGNEIDRVNYDGGPAFPAPTGASMALLIPGADNNAGANWCTSTTPFGSGGSGDSGTPGAVNDCAGTPEIFDLQGSGAFSPFEDLAVITRDNVVTGVTDEGFFMQTPVARDDFDATTSNGIFVFTDGAPGVAVGDLVDVVGTVTEFFSFTEFDDDGLTVTVTSSATPPDPVLLDSLTPAPGPFDPPDMERLEGMLAELVDGIATGPTDGFGDTAVTVGPDRTFREAGIEFPSPHLGPPEWDGNQEVFEVDPDGLGLADADIFATQTVSAVGPLGFFFGDYQILPSFLALGPDPAILQPVREREPGEFTVGSFNLFRLNGGFAKLSAHVVEVLGSPDILAVQEVQDIGELEALADRIALDDPTVVYTPSLIEGNDPGGIDVGFLTRQTIQIDSLTQVDPDVTFVNPVTLEDNILHDRPPLLLEGRCQLEFGSFPIAVMAVHNRSLGSIEDPTQGVRVRKKRFLQAVSIAEEVAARQASDPGIRLVVTGDFNAFEFTDGYVDAVGVITGDFDPAGNLVCSTENCAGLPDNDLFDEVLGLPAAQRYSFVFGGNAQVLDHALTSVGLAAEITGAEYGRGNADAAADLINDDTTPENISLRSSDHDGLVVYILEDEDADGVPNDLDVCAGTVIPESVPTVELQTNRWALVDGDGQFDTNPPNGNGPGAVFTLGDTAGCSCEQIITAQGLGEGHVRHGCSVGAMRNWVALVNP